MAYDVDGEGEGEGEKGCEARGKRFTGRGAATDTRLHAVRLNIAGPFDCPHASPCSAVGCQPVDKGRTME